MKYLQGLPELPPKILRGKNTNIHPSANLGGSGFTWARDEEGFFVLGPNRGDIVIGDRVEIGEYSVIKRSTLPNTATEIGKGTVIRNFVSVGHNCKIGERCWLGPHVCLNGSVEIEDDCWIGGHAVIHQQRKIGKGARVGIGAVVVKDVPPGETVAGNPAVPTKFIGNCIDSTFVHGKNLQIGKYNHIHENVRVGDDVVIRSYVELRPGTMIGNGCYIDSGVKTSGGDCCVIGDNVTVRFDAIIARNTIIEDDVFISPQVMFININFRGLEIDEPTIVRKGAKIGTNATVYAGVEIAEGVIIGAGAMVARDCLEKWEIYRAASEIVAKRR